MYTHLNKGFSLNLETFVHNSDHGYDWEPFLTTLNFRINELLLTKSDALTTEFYEQIVAH